MGKLNTVSVLLKVSVAIWFENNFGCDGHGGADRFLDGSTLSVNTEVSADGTALGPTAQTHVDLPRGRMAV